MAKRVHGIYPVERNGATYWYGRKDGRTVYYGKGDKGKKIGEAAKAKEITRKYEDREVQSGLKTKRVELRTVRALFLWYLELPEVQRLDSYENRVDLAGHLTDFFGDKFITACDPDGQRSLPPIPR